MIYDIVLVSGVQLQIFFHYRLLPGIAYSSVCVCVCVCVFLVTQSCPTLCSPMDGNLPGSCVHGVLQARILEWVAISFLQGIFLTQVLNPYLLHRPTDSLLQSHKERRRLWHNFNQFL